FNGSHSKQQQRASLCPPALSVSLRHQADRLDIDQSRHIFAGSLHLVLCALFTIVRQCRCVVALGTVLCSAFGSMIIGRCRLNQCCALRRWREYLSWLCPWSLHF